MNERAFYMISHFVGNPQGPSLSFSFFSCDCAAAAGAALVVAGAAGAAAGAAVVDPFVTPFVVFSL
jgi:hypothetical protein